MSVPVAASRRSSFFILIFTWIMISPIFPSYVHALNWDQSAGANTSVGYDDNFRLTESDKVSTSTASVGVLANITGSSEVSTVNLAVDASGNTHSEASIDDYNAYNIGLDALRRGERMTGNAGVRYESNSTTETELFDTGTTEDGIRKVAIFSAGLGYQVSERNLASVDVVIRDVSYDTVSLTPYQDNSVGLSWRHQLDELQSISLSLRTSEYEPEDGDTTNTHSVSLGYRLDPTESISYGFSVGYSKVERTGDDDTGGNYSADVKYQQDERNSFSALASRNFAASGSGGVREEDRLGVSWIHNLSEKSQTNLGVDAFSADDRDYAAVEAGYKYQYTLGLSLSGSVRIRQISDDNVDATSNSVFLSLAYTLH